MKGFNALCPSGNGIAMTSFFLRRRGKSLFLRARRKKRPATFFLGASLPFYSLPPQARATATPPFPKRRAGGKGRVPPLLPFGSGMEVLFFFLVLWW